ncbi:MAG: AAA family ATPase [Acidobacteriia bacterium]|nr:AAA family ATPase [Terriglobia bacterium]
MTSPSVVQLAEEPKIVTENTDLAGGRAEGLKPETTKPETKPETPKPKLPEHNKTEPWEIRRLSDAFKDAQSPPWVITDLVMSGTLTLVSAQPHGMKSLSWLAAGMEAVHTGKVFKHFEAPNLKNVLFIETEDPEWLVKKRIQGLAKGLKLSKDETLPGFHYTCPGPFELIKEEKQLERLIEEPDSLQEK